MVGGRAVDRTAASTSQVGRFETEVLTDPDNLAALMAMPGQWGGSNPRTPPDEEVDPRHGQFGQRDLRPAGRLDVQRPLRVRVLSPAVHLQPRRRCGAGAAAQRERRQRRRLAVGAGAGDRAIPRAWMCPGSSVATRHSPSPSCTTYSKPRATSTRSGSRRTRCSNATSATCSHVRWADRRSGRSAFYHSFEYQAKSWDQPRRVVAKVEWHQGELFPRVGFIVTNLGGGSQARGGLLQRSRNRRAVDQGGQARGPLDASVLPRLRRQPGAAATASCWRTTWATSCAGWRCRRV